jgi:hypothetical protein
LPDAIVTRCLASLSARPYKYGAESAPWSSMVMIAKFLAIEIGK